MFERLLRIAVMAIVWDCRTHTAVRSPGWRSGRIDTIAAMIYSNRKLLSVAQHLFCFQFEFEESNPLCGD